MLATKCPHTQRLQTFRLFSSSASHQRYKSQKHKLEQEHKDIAPYPHGPSLWYKQSNEGLYGGQRVQFGNNVSERTEIKTRRNWHPNVQRKALYSAALDRRIKVRVSTRVLRTIDKVGGLDEYLLGDKASRIRDLGMEGWKLRCMVMAQPEVQERMNRQRTMYGLPQVDYAELESQIQASEGSDLPISYDGLEDGGEFQVEVDQDTDTLVDELEDSTESGTTGNQSFDDRAREAKEANWKESMSRA